jgi:hypothetical protein
MTDNNFTVTQKEAADFLQVSTKSISRYRKRGLPYKLILNPVAGKQEVRFCYADLERWHEGRQLLATYARNASDPVDSEGGSGKRENQMVDPATHQGFLADLLAAYKEQIELLRDQLEDMREQLGRRDRQIDDLMRLMVGLQLEYKPMTLAPTDASAAIIQEAQRTTDLPHQKASERLFETIPLPEHFQQKQTVATPTLTAQDAGSEKKIYSREQLSASILRLRRKGKSYAEITGALNQIEAATLSGQPQWTALEVRTLLPALMDSTPQSLADRGEF